MAPQRKRFETKIPQGGKSFKNEETEWGVYHENDRKSPVTGKGGGHDQVDKEPNEKYRKVARTSRRQRDMHGGILRKEDCYADRSREKEYRERNARGCIMTTKNKQERDQAAEEVAWYGTVVERGSETRVPN